MRLRNDPCVFQPSLRKRAAWDTWTRRTALNSSNNTYQTQVTNSLPERLKRTIFLFVTQMVFLTSLTSRNLRERAKEGGWHQCSLDGPLLQTIWRGDTTDRRRMTSRGITKLCMCVFVFNQEPQKHAGLQTNASLSISMVAVYALANARYACSHDNIDPTMLPDQETTQAYLPPTSVAPVGRYVEDKFPSEGTPLSVAR